MERRAGGALEPTGAGRVAPKNHHALAEARMSKAAIPAASAASDERLFGKAARQLRGFRLGGNADPQRIDPYRLGDVLELGRAEIGDHWIEPAFDLPIGVLGETDAARFANALEPRRDVDAVAHEVAVALLDDVAQVNANAILDPPFRRHAGVALDESVLHFDRAAHRVDDAAELDDAPVPGAFDDAPVMGGDGRIDEVAPEAPETRERSLLVDAGEPGVAGDVRDQDRSELAGLGHRAPLC